MSPYQFKLGADGKVVYGAITEETRSALALLHTWYKAGLIVPESLRQITIKLMKVANQKIGMVDNMKWGIFDKDSGFVTKPGADKGQIVVAGLNPS